MRRRPTRARDRLIGLLATLTLLGIVVGLPMTLLALGANPIPHALPTLDQVRTALFSPDDGTLALGAIKIVAWASWVFLTGSILLEIVSRLRGVQVPDVPGMRVSQWAARGLVGAATAMFVVTASGTPTAAALFAGTHHAGVTATAAVAPGSGSGQAEARGPAGPASVRSTQTPTTAPDTVEHTVKSGESLWSIAVDYLGSGIRYTEIAALNAEVLDGRPSFLVPGTVLRLPTPTSKDDVERATHSYTVHKGDTLSEIAEDELGDASRYPDVFKASKSTTQPGGVHLSDPDVIDVGWTLTIPGQAAALPGGSSAPSSSSTSSTPPRSTTHSRTAPTAGPTGAPTPGALVPSWQAPATSTARSAPGPIDAPATASVTDAQDEQSNVPPWMLAGLTGGGLVLAGSMMLVLTRRRHDQFRARRPGRTIATPELLLAPVEKTIVTVGAAAAPTVEFMDEVLRRLAAAHSSAGQAMLELAAVQLGRKALTLHLSAAAVLGAPWQGSADQLHWTLATDANAEEVGPAVPDLPAPYPLLVTIGMSDGGDVWLFNCEDVNLSVTGDATFGRDFARYLAAEIACNPWSHGVRLDCVGVAEEVASMNPERVRTYGHERDPAAEMLADAVATIDRATELEMDVVTARSAQAGADAWPARMLLVDAAHAGSTALNQLLDLVREHAGHTATAVVVRGEREATPGVVLHMTSDGRVILPHADLSLVAVGLTVDEAQGCAALLAQSEELEDVEIPVDDDAEDGWRSWSNEAGALREERTRPRNTREDEHTGPLTSVLDLADEVYVSEGATTVEDLEALAPKVPVAVRSLVESADPTLDEDVALWFAADCRLPRLTLLGPVHARTRGIPVTRRKPYFTEILAYVATRPHGATPEELADAFNITPMKARDYVGIVREWLGVSPRTGDKHLPDAREAPAAKARGVPVYQVTDLLVDADLFRRLRLRGEARGSDGMGDLGTALRLVQGRPFDRLRAGGWAWLSEGDRLDQHMLCSIVDVAHVATTYSLAAGDLTQARRAAETAARAAPYEETPRLDLAAVAAAEGHYGEAERILRDEVCNRTDDDGAPTDLSTRTGRIISDRGWLDRDQTAS